MSDDHFLYKELDGVRKHIGLKPVPAFVEKNLNPAFELRKYQRKAFENFITYFEGTSCPRPTQLLFHMATGSGKTLIMAGLILYLYARGYRNFLFFVNLSNIVDKTRDNFLNPASAKYLFAESITIDGARVRVNVTENFWQSDADAINICFTTTQGLHMDLTGAKENCMTLDDFAELKVVLISDEAHHLNVDTGKKLSAKDSEHRETWENTIKNILSRNAENVLLEFTATCDTSNALIRRKYEDKIIFDYTLKNFYDDGYSKEIITFRSSSLDDRVLSALVLSQYRLKVFGDNNLSVKPVVLFKSKKISESKDFMEKFIGDVKNLDGEKLRDLSGRSHNELRRAFDYFAGKGISFDALAAELRRAFVAENCISANEDKKATDKQNALNNLEDNNYRAVFEVKRLDEGWDVLNLFDIVRLYETRQKSETLSEAQLIGRGARYCPFVLDDAAKKYRRKFDGDANHEMRICETLCYHCENDRRYISELHKALHELGLEVDRETREHKLKESFKREEFYMHGVIYINDREEVRREFGAIIPEKIYTFERTVGGGRDRVMTTTVESVEAKIERHTVRRTIAEIAAQNYAIVNKALMKFPVYKFAALKERFPTLQTTREFITSEKYLGGVKIDITGNTPAPDNETLRAAVIHVLKIIGDALSKETATYKGTTEFFAREVSKIFRDKNITLQKATARLDLTAAAWYAHEDNFGTSEEQALIDYFARKIDGLRETYGKVFLIRNEREFGIYTFADGRRFEPDFVLFLQKKGSDELDFLQIFIEPKGEHLTEHDAWKENFLRELATQAVPAEKVFGLPFYNRERESEFDSAFEDFLKR